MCGQIWYGKFAVGRPFASTSCYALLTVALPLGEVPWFGLVGVICRCCVWRLTPNIMQQSLLGHLVSH
jgi:hypothetical protein